MAKRVALGPNGEPNKRPRGPALMEGHRFAISTLIPGIVIGKGGARIKSIKEEANVFISISDRHPQSQDFIMVIRGEPVEAAHAILLISQAILDANATASEDKQAATGLRILCHSTQAGTLIGKGGAAIKQMMAESGAKIRLSTDVMPNSTEKSCDIAGSPEQLQAAALQVLTKLTESPVRENVEIVPYLAAGGHAAAAAPYGQMGGQQMSQMMANPAMAAYYGYPAMGGGSAPMRSTMSQGQGMMGAGMMGVGAVVENVQFELFVPAEAGGAIIGKGGQAVKHIKQNTNCNVSVGEVDPANNNMRTVTIKGSSATLPTALDMIRTLAEPTGSPPQTEFISMPSSCSGTVIGKGGKTIKEMKMVSGCNISIAEANPESPDMRTVTITGSPIAIQIAAFLVRQKCEQPQQGQGGGDQSTEQFMIPASAASTVIGKSGATIDAIKTQSGCNISVRDPSEETPDTRMVVIKGSPAGIQIARSIIAQYAGAM